MWKYTLNPKPLLVISLLQTRPDKNKGNKLTEDVDQSRDGTGNESSDDSDRTIHFNDTEENMMNGFDEGYNVGVNVGN